MTDRLLIFGSAGLRATAVGLSGVVLALHLAALGFSAAAVGLAVSLGLGGCALSTLVVTYVADHWGRRATLIALALLMAGGGMALAWMPHPRLILLSLFVGMLNGMGRDRGAGVTVEQAMLPQTTGATTRTAAFAWYNVVVDAGHAVGSLLGGLPAFLRSQAGISVLDSYQWTWGLYSGLCLLAGLCVWRLSRTVELDGSTRSAPLSPRSRGIVAKFAALSGLDSLGGGFLTTALLSYWFFRRFGVDEALLGPLFFTVRILNGLSHLGPPGSPNGSDWSTQWSGRTCLRACCS